MQFTFLGTGTSAGVPTIACECDVCRSDDPRDARLRTSGCFRFTDATGKERVILIDAGPDLRQQSLREGLDRCDAILFTHNHVDHTFGLDEVRRFNVAMRAPIEIYASDHTLAFLNRVYGHIFERHKNVNDSFVASLSPIRIEPGEAFSLYGLRVTPIELLHGKLPVLGFRFDREDDATDSLFPFAYCTDVSAIPPDSWKRLTGLRTLVLDALRHRQHPTHFTIDQAVRAAERIDADSTWFVHMSHEVSHAETDESLPKGMALAYDGLTLR